MSHAVTVLKQAILPEGEVRQRTSSLTDTLVALTIEPHPDISPQNQNIALL